MQHAQKTSTMISLLSWFTIAYFTLMQPRLNAMGIPSLLTAESEISKTITQKEFDLIWYFKKKCDQEATAVRFLVDSNACRKAEDDVYPRPMRKKRNSPISVIEIPSDDDDWQENLDKKEAVEVSDNESAPSFEQLKNSITHGDFPTLFRQRDVLKKLSYNHLQELNNRAIQTYQIILALHSQVNILPHTIDLTTETSIAMHNEDYFKTVSTVLENKVNSLYSTIKKSTNNSTPYASIRNQVITNEMQTALAMVNFFHEMKRQMEAKNLFAHSTRKRKLKQSPTHSE